MAYPLTEKMFNKLLRDAAKLNDPTYLERPRKQKREKLCHKCKYEGAARCGPSKEALKCEMFKPKPSSRPKQNNRKLFAGKK